jgi:hypothetical protein
VGFAGAWWLFVITFAFFTLPIVKGANIPEGSNIFRESIILRTTLLLDTMLTWFFKHIWHVK